MVVKEGRVPLSIPPLYQNSGFVARRAGAGSQDLTQFWTAVPLCLISGFSSVILHFNKSLALLEFIWLMSFKNAKS